EISAEEAVKAYHGVLQKLGVKPHRSLEEDMQLQTNVMNYGGTGAVISTSSPSQGAATTAKKCACGCNGKKKACPAPSEAPAVANGEPDFKRMTAAQKVAYHKARWDRILG